MVSVPTPEQFRSAEGYYGTLFHELTHSTGHETRLDRPELVDTAGFGSPTYSREELVAEIGAAFLENDAGLEVDYQNDAAYLATWIGRLRGAASWRSRPRLGRRRQPTTSSHGKSNVGFAGQADQGGGGS
jgi:antirestriction protein ArdC